MVLHKSLGSLGSFFGALDRGFFEVVQFLCGPVQALLHTGAHLGGLVAHFVGSHSQQSLCVFDGEFNVLHNTGSLGGAVGTHGVLLSK